MSRLLVFFILGNGKQSDRKCAFWNMLFSVLWALQSAIMLLCVSRICGAEQGGIFSIAYATGQLMYVIGTYSLRNFQATDTLKIYSYFDYRQMRYLSCAVMLVVSVLYCLFRQYAPYKSGVVLSACFLKMIESLEDLYHGELQRSGRLDVAGREGTIRLILSDIVFLVVLLTTKNLAAAMLSVSVTAMLTISAARRLFANELKRAGEARRAGSIKELITSCFPLFWTGLLSLYISNSSKYAIDTYLSETAQTYFSVIFMPLFTINLLSGIIYRPQMGKMSILWNSGEKKTFKSMVLRQCGIIAGISASVLIFGVTLGIKLLELMYGLPLRELRSEFMVLLAGGGLVSLYNYLVACTTIIRKQGILTAISTISALAAAILSKVLVANWGIAGACWTYTILMLCEAAGIAAFFCFYLLKGEKKERTL